jgi:DNA excision repair protein ERCC-4
LKRGHSELRPDDFEVTVDTREQQPLDLVVDYEGAPLALRVAPGTLQTGDYAVTGLERHCVVERKALGDLISCVSSGRERFERELERTRGIDLRLLVVESHWASIELGQYVSKVSPKAVIGSIYTWRVRYGLHIEMAGDRQRAALIVARTLYATARERWRELQAFSGGLKLMSGKKGA